ncbi:MAG: hypothetical protein Q4Q26_01790 [Eubacteriales bacterium]|nr:hypothetical protein [Eubacteriales bacterium]
MQLWGKQLLLFVGRGFIYRLCDEKEIIFYISTESLSWNLYHHQSGKITAGSAISQASADMMLDLIIGKSEEEAMKLAEIFLRMIKGEVTYEEMDQLEEASVLKDISHMPARVKCAVLGWHTMEEMLKTEKE